MNWSEIESSISETIGQDYKVINSRSVGGGSINSAYLLEGHAGNYFVKLNAKHFADMFEAEAEGLIELAKPDVIHVPSVICWGDTASQTFIVMENISLGRGGNDSSSKFGLALAKMHQTFSERYGWFRENTIGSTPQINIWNKSWVDFYRTHRLQFQIDLATKNGASHEIKNLGDSLCDQLDSFFTSYQPKPSLLHGDLWSGNYGYDVEGNPVIFDPAVYFGDREADMAMTELFGGFPSDFYAAYNDFDALDEGYRVRKTLYNLYHVLNHFNLFGGGYQQQSLSMMRTLLAEIQ